MPKLNKKLIKVSAYDYAIFLLSLKLQSEGQIAEKLGKKAYPKEDIEAAILRLKELGYLNDNQFAQNYFDNLKKYKSFGYFGIKRKLMEKKIPSKLIEKTLRELTAKEELAIARRLLSKGTKVLDKQKQVRMLQSRGFRSQAVFEATKIRIGEEADN